mgnify:CR=1 FL=1|tara:strand:+ start:598 stop:1059 length:462 start_codon:yes stop_codon:yes gene_type:complete
MAFKMKGHTLPGPNQRKFEDDSIINSAPRKYETKNGVEGFKDTTLKDGRSASSAFQIKSAFKQTETDLRDWLLDERGFSQEEADQMIETGAYDVTHPEFKEWYAESGRGDEPAEPETPNKFAKGLGKGMLASALGPASLLIPGLRPGEDMSDA